MAGSNMTLATALRCIILGQVGNFVLGQPQRRYVGYTGIEFGSIPALSCISTAFKEA